MFKIPFVLRKAANFIHCEWNLFFYNKHLLCNKQGKLHSEDFPAYELTNGTKAWMQNGEYHRENGPAIIHDNGSKEWFLYGKRHRSDGPACIEFEQFLVGPDKFEEYYFLLGKQYSKEDYYLINKFHYLW